MKSVNFLKFLILSLILTVGAVGCKRTPKNVTFIPGAKPVVGPDQPNPMAGNPTIPPGRSIDQGPTPGSSSIDPKTGTADLVGRDENFNADPDTFKEQTVYFAFDSSTVRPEDKSKIDAVAAYLKGQPTFHLRVEGHCDERGTEEYNRALGERRAQAVREYLISVGIAAERVGTLSFGEDKPAVLGHDETAWTKNRRGEFILLKPKA